MYELRMVNWILGEPQLFSTITPSCSSMCLRTVLASVTVANNPPALHVLLVVADGQPVNAYVHGSDLTWWVKAEPGTPVSTMVTHADTCPIRVACWRQ